MSRTRSSTRTLLLAAAAVVSLSDFAQGTTFNVSWDGASTGSYGTAANWSTNTIPNDDTLGNNYYNAIINRVGGVNVTGNLAQIEVLNLTIGANAGNQLTLNDNVTFGVIGTAAFGPATITNAGTISLGATSSSVARFNCSGSSTNITGGGFINMLGGSQFTGSGTLTSNNTIVGVGDLGLDGIAFINNGTVSANGGTLTVDPRASGGFDNNGSLQGINAGTLVLTGNNGGIFTNTGGTISATGTGAAARGRVNLMNGVSISGGNIVTNSFGLFFVPGGNAATLNGVTSSADVNVGLGGTLTLLGTITNNNLIRTNSAAGVTTFSIGAGTTTLNGTGSLILSQFSGALGNVTGTGTLVNGASHSIFGAGTLGDGSTTIRNNGVIDANLSANTLVLKPETTGTGLFNAGTIRASSGNVQLSSMTVSNTGTFHVASTGIMFTPSTSGTNVDISGGTIAIDAGGKLRFLSTGASSTLSSVNIQNAGRIDLANGGTLTLNTCTINNSGSINIGEVVGTHTLAIGAGTTTLTGGGVLYLHSLGAGDNPVVTTNAVGCFLENADNRIHGAGTFGSTTLNVYNAGTITADSGGSLTFFTSGFNTGTIEAIGGTLNMRAGNNGLSSSGVVSATGAGTIDLSANISGGTITTDGSSRFQIVNNSGSLFSLTSNASVFVGGTTAGLGSTLTINGNLTDNNHIQVVAGAGDATLTTIGIASLLGSGTLTMGTAGGGAAVITTNSTLKNGAQHSIAGFGNLGNNSGSLTNDGTIIAQNSTNPGLVIDPGPGNFTNNGVLADSSAGILTLTGAGGGTFVNNGTISSNGGNTVRLTSGAAIAGGTLNSTGGNGLSIIAGATATLSNLFNSTVVGGGGNATLVLNGTVTNVGILTAGGGNPLGNQIRLGGGTVTLAGTGTILMSDGVDPGKLQGSGTLVNNGNLIRGAGLLGNNAIAIRNAATIRADVPGANLVVDPGSGNLVNTGTLAANGGILVLDGAGGGTFENTGGTISATNGTSLLRNGAFVHGGTFITDLNSLNLVQGSNATISDVNNTGFFAVAGGGTLTIAGTINNTNQLNVVVDSSPATLLLGGGTVTLTGGGVLPFGASGTGTATMGGSGTLDNINNDIRGAGNFGSNQVAIRNEASGQIRAFVAGKTLVVDPGSAGSWVNAGTMSAVGGATLELNGTGGGNLLGNSGGTISALDGSLVRLNALKINGGFLTSFGTGTVNVASNASATLENLTTTANLNVGSNSGLVISGLVTNNGTMNLDRAVALDTLTVLGSSTLNNNAAIAMTANIGASTRITGAGTINNSGSMVGGANVVIAPANSFRINNSGLIDSGPGGILVGTTTGGTNVINNTGTLRVGSGGSITINGDASVIGAGIIDIQANGRLNNDALSFSGGTVNLAGNFLNQSPATLGSVAGSGTFTNGLVNAGTATFTSMRVNTVEVPLGVMTTAVGGGTLGTSRVASLFIDTSDSKWDLTDHDLVVEYFATSPIDTIRSYLSVGYNGGAWTGNGLVSSSAAAATPHIIGLGYAEASDALGGAGVFSGQSVDSTTVLVKYTYMGDTDLNGQVDFDDYVRIDNGFNAGLTGWFNGDFDYNSTIDFDDYVLIDASFNQQNGTLLDAVNWLSGDDRKRSSSPGLERVITHYRQFGQPYADAFLAVAPEPSAVALLGIGAFALTRRRRA